jgi:hypothetical protein
MKPNNCQSEYDFTLVLTGKKGISDSAVNALIEAGCDDATVSVRSGRVYITFSRIASSIKDAIISAIKDVRSASIDMDVLRVDECNLVTQAEIARKIKRTRQLVNQYILGTRGPGGFPPPSCNICDDAPLWRWCEVAYWLCENDMIRSECLEEAETIDVVNNVLEWQHQKYIKPELAEEIMRQVGAR